MSRRCLLAVLVVIVCLPGCGLGLRKMGNGPLFGAWTESITYSAPPHRVALATLEAMRAELASADFARGRDSAFTVARDLMEPGKKIPRPGEPLPADSPALWVDWTARGDGHKERALVILTRADFEGKTVDGRAVQVGVHLQAPFEGRVVDGHGELVNGRAVQPKARGDVWSLVTVQVGRHGDPKLSRLLNDRISERLAHPLHPPGSIEEADTFRAFFGGVESREAIPSLRKPSPGPPG